MRRYITHRVLQGIVTIWLVTLGVFSVLRMTGDPVSYMLPPDASKEDRARLIALYGFNDPLWKQYVVFNNNLLHGRFGPSLAPVVVHIIAAAGYALFGAFQFPTRLRRHHPGWHRRSGRVLVGAGMAVAGSGLGDLFYPDAPGGVLLWTVRLVVGSAVATSIVLGYLAIRHHDIAAHRAWMIRAYALAVGAGTQTFTQGIGTAVFGTNDLSIALSLTSGWLINLAVAEWIIRRPGARRARRARAHALVAGAR